MKGVWNITHTHTRAHTRTHSLEHAHTHTHARTHSSKRAHTHTHTHMPADTHTLTHTRTHTRIYTHAHAHTHLPGFGTFRGLCHGRWLLVGEQERRRRLQVNDVDLSLYATVVGRVRGQRRQSVETSNRLIASNSSFRCIVLSYCCVRFQFLFWFVFFVGVWECLILGSDFKVCYTKLHKLRFWAKEANLSINASTVRMSDGKTWSIALCIWSWRFEPSQTPGIISGLKTNSNPSLTYTYKSFKTTHNISITQFKYFTTHTHTNTHYFYGTKTFLRYS